MKTILFCQRNNTKSIMPNMTNTVRMAGRIQQRTMRVVVKTVEATVRPTLKRAERRTMQFVAKAVDRPQTDPTLDTVAPEELVKEKKKKLKNKYEEASYWKYRKGKEIRAARDRKYPEQTESDERVLIMNSSEFLNAYIKNITPIVIKERKSYADAVKSGWC